MDHYPFPYLYSRGFYFVLELNGGTIPKADIADALTEIAGDKWQETIRLAPNTYPVNCTIPEMLRDLYGFPVKKGGHISALAFDPEDIGKGRYNVAQAALRRTCSRLENRRLIAVRGAQSYSLFSSIYSRSGIGLTPCGWPVPIKRCS